MHFTDIFIRRPVLATVVSLLILVLGLRSMGVLKVREYPETQNAVVTVATTYTGADPALVAGFITTPLENSIAQANGIDYLTSASIQSQSTIQAYLRLNYDPNKALTEINTKVNAVLNQLPKDTQQPVITVAIGEAIDSMYIGFYSKVLPTNKITDYLIRVVQPKLQAVEGVQTAEVLGQRRFALRAWLDPVKMAAFGVTAGDVSTALANNDFISAVGRTKGQMVTVDLIATTNLHSVDEFRNMVLKSANGAIVRLGNVASVTLGSENYDTAVGFDGESAVYIGIKVAPTANLLTVIDGVRKVFPVVEQQLPEGLSGRIVYDATKYVNSSIHEVITTLLEALAIVTLVIFLVLGSLRSVIIPTIAMPLSLIGAFFIMLLMGYTINLLTLLALVLAIGLVVDDAIIVVENVHRHMENGMAPMEASIQGARELAGPIIAISVVLVAVYVPIGFMGGLTGALFTEFAYTLAGAVAVSAVIALTLSPMMCSRSLKSFDHGAQSRFVQFIDGRFALLRRGYERLLAGALNYLPVTVVFAVIILASNYFLYANAKSELAPQEDQGYFLSLITAAPNATLEQTQLNSRQVYRTFAGYPECDHVFQLDGITGLNSGLAGMVLKPWEERKRTVMQIYPDVQMRLFGIAGVRAVAFQPSPLPGSGGGLPVQFVVGTTEPFERLNEVSQALMAKAYASGMFAFIDTDLKIDKPQVTVEIDRDKAAQLGLTMRDVGDVLGAMLGEGYVNYFDLAGRSYKVIPQVMQRERLNAAQLRDYYLTTAGGVSIPLATIAQLKTTVVPESLNHFQQLNSATISGVPVPGVTLGQALETLNGIAKDVMPQGYGIDYAGQLRQYVQESSALLVTFFFALIIIFLSLAALFESFRDPFTVLISVPMSICGAMIFISLGVGGASLNIYTEVGLVTLIGLISKHGILIVQFANDLQREGKGKREAVELAAAIRLRPILMTTAAMVLGVLPLVTASGAGAVGRFNMGLVIMTGIAIGTLFTLFVVPAMYMLLAAEHAGQNPAKIPETKGDH
ncbi:efflux RND transporter permease subunit [Geotalea uraniireducens]|uniref:Acriflavin resistance protein n=1 Tax=Geotalea uraniireducens (strain Rf4) TaxID=351605 RepID=A5GCF6_GEOUR|nr:efflux RND transporter permease subunit [Geotalea uraniireducens]ABQ24742.1 acriflavin resistance protein [Geotalea uraniireducens Rf4]